MLLNIPLLNNMFPSAKVWLFQWKENQIIFCTFFFFYEHAVISSFLVVTVVAINTLIRAVQ